MNLNEIIDCIKAWNQNRRDTSTIKALFNDKAFFNFEHHFSNTKHVHAYPGIKNDELVFFLIAASNDNESGFSDPSHPPLIIKANTYPKLDNSTSSEIEPEEAQFRITYWEGLHNQWLQTEIPSDNGIYQAFIIPVEDNHVGHEHKAFFALKPDSNTLQFTADLIIKNTTISSVQYRDMVYPVPPFDSGIKAKSNFYLLSLAE